MLKEKQERKKEDQEETKKKLQEGTSEVSVTNAKRNELLEKKRPLERQIHELMVNVSSVCGILLLCCIETITDYQSRDVSSEK